MYGFYGLCQILNRNAEPRFQDEKTEYWHPCYAERISAKIPGRAKFRNLKSIFLLPGTPDPPFGVTACRLPWPPRGWWAKLKADKATQN